MPEGESLGFWWHLAPKVFPNRSSCPGEQQCLGATLLWCGTIQPHKSIFCEDLCGCGGQEGFCC